MLRRDSREIRIESLSAEFRVRRIGGLVGRKPGRGSTFVRSRAKLTVVKVSATTNKQIFRYEVILVCDDFDFPLLAASNCGTKVLIHLQTRADHFFHRRIKKLARSCHFGGRFGFLVSHRQAQLKRAPLFPSNRRVSFIRRVILDNSTPRSTVQVRFRGGGPSW